MAPDIPVTPEGRANGSVCARADEPPRAAPSAARSARSRSPAAGRNLRIGRLAIDRGSDGHRCGGAGRRKPPVDRRLAEDIAQRITLERHR